MRFAMLGVDDDLLQWKQTSATAPDYEWMLVSAADWESLLARSDYDAVLVGGGSDESLRAEQIRKLVSGGVQVVAWHPTVDVLTAYELEMIRSENRGILLPFAPGWRHPAWDRLCDLITGADSSPLGNVEQISLQRFLPDRRFKRVSAHFGRDVRAIRRLLGNITSVNAVGVARSEDAWSSLTVHFAGDQGCSAIWSLATTTADSTSRVNLAGNRGYATLMIPSSPATAAWELHIHPARDGSAHADSHVNSEHDNPAHQLAFPDFDEIGCLVNELERVRQGQLPASSWLDACLDLEIAESAEKSLRRKRGIDLYTAERSEEKTFKGFMAAAGCLILTVILFAFLGFAVWDGIRAPFREPPVAAAEPRESTWPLWARLWPVYPLAAFLLLQLLVLITRDSNRDDLQNVRQPDT